MKLLKPPPKRQQLCETPSSRTADIKDALHIFYLGVRERNPKLALNGAKRLQQKRYTLGYSTKYQTKDGVFNLSGVSATTLDPKCSLEDLFTAPIARQVSPAEYFTLKQIGKLQYPEMHSIRTYYSSEALPIAIRICQGRTRLWNALKHIQRVETLEKRHNNR